MAVTDMVHARFIQSQMFNKAVFVPEKAASQINRLLKNLMRREYKLETSKTPMLYRKRVMHIFYNGLGLLLSRQFNGVGNWFGAGLRLQICPQRLG